jgi:hypothetical protein
MQYSALPRNWLFALKGDNLLLGPEESEVTTTLNCSVAILEALENI